MYKYSHTCQILYQVPENFDAGCQIILDKPEGLIIGKQTNKIIMKHSQMSTSYTGSRKNKK